MMKMLLKLILNIILGPRKDSDLALENHMMNMVSIDFFTVPTARFRLLFVLVILSHRRRQIVYFNVTTTPTGMWTAQQIVEAFPWDKAPKYLLRDRDSIYGAYFRQRVKNMGIKEVIIAARSPWQNPFVERLIGSIRRDCLDHVIVLNESHLSRILSSYFGYYHYYNKMHKFITRNPFFGTRMILNWVEKCGNLYYKMNLCCGLS